MGRDSRFRSSSSRSWSRARGIGPGTMRLRSSTSSWRRGVNTLPGMVTMVAARAAETVEWALSIAVAKLLTDSAKSRLVAVPHATLVAMDRDDSRHILGQGNLDDPITIEDIRKAW